MRAWALLIAYVVALVVACASAGQGDSQTMKPRWLAAIVYKQFRPAGMWAVQKAYCIVGRESTWNPRAISPTGDYGLFQINYSAHHRSFDWSRILEPHYNTYVAWRLSNRGHNWQPWAGGSYSC
jgi:hypothetical protein